MQYYSYLVPEDYSKNERLDRYIASLTDGMNRSKLKNGLCSIKVNGKQQKISYKVKSKDEIKIEWEDSVPDDIEPEDIRLYVIYEDDNVCVIDKEQGMVTHPAAGNWSGTLVNALLYHYGKNKIENVKIHDSMCQERLRPGIVHRLDKDTSGIIITAKNRASHEFLQKQFQNHRSLTKEYIAICQGRPQYKTGKIETQIIRDPRDRKKFKAVTGTNDGKKAISYYKCIACYGQYSLMRVRIATGRTHQIRVHMKYLNCPILGDELYGNQDKIFPKATLMLNSHKLIIQIPEKKEKQTFKSSTPIRFKHVMKKLHSLYQKTLL